jgi:HAD superfamily hydrolase (TIGR01509 family)
LKPKAVLFDCDGVLVDSEPITNGLLRDMLQEQGWTLSSAECMRLFVGKAVIDQTALIESHTGKPLTGAWMDSFRQRRNRALQLHLKPIDNIHQAVRELHTRYGGRIACASGADRFKVELQLQKTGLMPYFEGRIFSGHEMPRTKPAPDVYLAAAASLGIPAEHCLVVEDSVTGVMAGVAAGATVIGFSPSALGHDLPDALRQAGARHIVTDMADLPALAFGL